MDSLFNVFYNGWLYVGLLFVVGLYFFAHRDGFNAGVIAGVNRTLDELVREGLLYLDEREELKRKKL